jgi:hypothetical protein
MFFRAGLPTTMFHLPLVSRDLLVYIGRWFGGGDGDGDGDDITEFWLSFFANPANEGHQILQRLITLRPFYSYWNTPAITTLMDVYKKVPTSICFGEADTIIPSHIGEFIEELTRGEIMIQIVKNANHNPCVNIDCMVEFLSSILNGTWTSTQSARRNLHKITGIDDSKKTRQNCRGFSYHSLETTGESFQRVYDYLLTNTTYCPPHFVSPP